MKTFCECSRKHEMEIIAFKRQKMKLLSNKQQKSYGTEKNGLYLLK